MIFSPSVKKPLDGRLCVGLTAGGLANAGLTFSFVQGFLATVWGSRFLSSFQQALALAFPLV